MALRNLTRENIEGQRIEALLQTPYRFEQDGYGACRVFVKMQNDLCFELIYSDSGDPEPIWQINESEYDLISAELPKDVTGCRGETILKVMRSNRWPAIGLLLSSKRFLYLNTLYNHWAVGPCLTDVDWFFRPDDVVPYWP